MPQLTPVFRPCSALSAGRAISCSLSLLTASSALRSLALSPRHFRHSGLSTRKGTAPGKKAVSSRHTRLSTTWRCTTQEIDGKNDAGGGGCGCGQAAVELAGLFKICAINAMTPFEHSLSRWSRSSTTDRQRVSCVVSSRKVMTRQGTRQNRLVSTRPRFAYPTVAFSTQTHTPCPEFPERNARVLGAGT